MTTTFDMSVPAEREAGLARAAEMLARGEVVAIPTETVYGLAADATNGEAVARVYEIKGRPQFNPLIVHVATREAAEAIAVFDEAARRLAGAFWPGPLTLVLPKRAASGLADLTTAGLETVALRMPAHPVAQELLRRFGRPLAAPSANRSGRVSPTTAAHVAADLGGDIGVILDGGPSAVGIESTIVAVDEGRVTLLRSGGVTREEIERIAGPLLAANDGAVRAPGMLASHYAPTAILKLNATSVDLGWALLAFGPRKVRGAKDAVATHNLSPTGDLREAAGGLFAALRDLDRQAGAIAVMPIPETGLGAAINDRLRRAAAPRHEPKLPVPAEFTKLCQWFHQDIFYMHPTLESAVNAAIQALDREERTALGRFLDQLLSGPDAAAKAERAWRESPADCYVEGTEGPAILLRQIREELR